MSQMVLQSLTLQNFATFENQIVHFNRGFNAIVGETGSGKSLILTAFQLLLGQRAEKKTIRKGCEFAVVEGLFTIKDKAITDHLMELGFPCEGDTFTLKRILHSSGNSKAFVNSLACSTSILQNLGREFIDLVGQFENQKLLSHEYQLQLLDSFAGIEQEVRQYQRLFGELSELKSQLNLLNSANSQRLERAEFLRFQIQEVNQLGLSANEEIELSRQRDLCLNGERNKESLRHSQQALVENDINVIDLLGIIRKSMLSLRGLDHNSDLELLEESISKLQDLSFSLAKQEAALDTDYDLNSIMQRLDAYQKIKRKYGLETPGILERVAAYEEELSKIDGLDFDRESVTKKIESTHQKALLSAKNLHTKRKISAATLSQKITELVHEMNMNGACIEMRLSECELGGSGISEAALWAETNPGEGLHKIRDIASGGELSRVLLALRSVISNKDSISIFFFDEIDTGVGGETALKIGKVLASVANQSQVVVITHLPQIANFADSLVIVSKETSQVEDGKRTTSQVVTVTGRERKPHIEAMVPLQ
jgi:DNA repair protein RecN (Recombination protein N)